jgi:hypothetical protein
MKSHIWLVLALSANVPFTAQAQNLVSGAGVKVEKAEIEQQISRSSAESKNNLTKPGALKTAVTNIYVRRVLATEALKSGVDKNPLVKEAIAKASGK